MKIIMPEGAKFIINTIQAAGYEAYAVGGCVRDFLMGRTPDDWDITTSASPKQVKELFRKTIDTGIAHGTVTVLYQKQGYEVTTYRVDGKYEDSRHPKEVIFTPNLTEDLKRRDFTINAMAYNEEAGLVDIFGGAADLEAKIIRCVGDPKERFSEDALRMMRAVRFSAQLGFQIEEQTKAAIQSLCGTLTRISAERIQTELVKLLVSDHPEELLNAAALGITGVVLPEFDAMLRTPQNHPHHMYNVGIHSIKACQEVGPDKNLRLAMLFHDIGKPNCITCDEQGIHHFHGHAKVSEAMTKTILKRLRFDNDTISYVSRLVAFHDYGNGVKPNEKLMRRALNQMGEDLFPDFFLVRRADVLAQSMYLREEKLKNLEEWMDLYEEVKRKQQCVSLKTLAVTGSDLIANGFVPGAELGNVLHQLLELVIEDPEKNTKEILLQEAKKYLKI